MADTHYIEIDAEKLWTVMKDAYIAAGGDILYAGDEKETLLRAVQAMLIQHAAAVDTALSMSTLRYAVGEFLDMYGAKRNCPRIAAEYATATATVVIGSTAITGTIPAGQALTADGEHIFLTLEDITLLGQAQTVVMPIRAEQAGIAGNGLTAGTVMWFTKSQPGVQSVTAASDSVGGRDAEDDETYRERIRTHGLAALTTGPEVQYESVAKGVSTSVIDAHAKNGGAGNVTVLLLLADPDDTTIPPKVLAALSAEDVRPLTDTVTVSLASPVSYTLHLQYVSEDGSDISAAIQSAVDEYKARQDTRIGEPFNPDRLLAAAYRAGASRVTWGTGSNFDGGTVTYTEIEDDEYCAGTIDITRVTV